MVRVWPQPCSSTGGLACDAGRDHRLYAQAGLILRAQPGAGCAARGVRVDNRYFVCPRLFADHFAAVADNGGGGSFIELAAEDLRDGVSFCPDLGYSVAGGVAAIQPDA